MNNNKNLYVSVESVRNEIKRIMDENERFILGRTDEKEVYAGEVVLTQLRRLFRKYENITDVPMEPSAIKDKQTPITPNVAVAAFKGIRKENTILYYCPRCYKRLYQVRNGHYFNPKYCEICGQAIDWRKEVDL